MMYESFLPKSAKYLIIGAGTHGLRAMLKVDHTLARQGDRRQFHERLAHRGLHVVSIDMLLEEVVVELQDRCRLVSLNVFCNLRR